MLTFFIVLFVFGVSLALCIRCSISCRDDELTIVTNAISFLVAIGTAIAIIGMIICFITTAAHSRYDYEVLEQERTSLEYRLNQAKGCETDDAIVELNSLYADINDYNTEIKKYKYWGSNLWTNWFYSQKIVRSSKYINIR